MAISSNNVEFKTPSFNLLDPAVHVLSKFYFTYMYTWSWHCDLEIFNKNMATYYNCIPLLSILQKSWNQHIILH